MFVTQKVLLAIFDDIFGTVGCVTSNERLDVGGDRITMQIQEFFEVIFTIAGWRAIIRLCIYLKKLATNFYVFLKDGMSH